MIWTTVLVTPWRAAFKWTKKTKSQNTQWKAWVRKIKILDKILTRMDHMSPWIPKLSEKAKPKIKWWRTPKTTIRRPGRCSERKVWRLTLIKTLMKSSKKPKEKRLPQWTLSAGSWTKIQMKTTNAGRLISTTQRRDQTERTAVQNPPESNPPESPRDPSRKKAALDTKMR